MADSAAGVNGSSASTPFAGITLEELPQVISVNFSLSLCNLLNVTILNHDNSSSSSSTTTSSNNVNFFYDIVVRAFEFIDSDKQQQQQHTKKKENKQLDVRHDGNTF